MAKSHIIRKKMVVGQIYTNKVQDERVLAALEAMPREEFVPEKFKSVAYTDKEIQLEEGRFMLEPMVFARLIQAAEIKPTDKVLDLACASGYSTAVISLLAEEVTAIESRTALVEKAQKSMQKLGINNVKFFIAELLLGANKNKQFDLIFIGGQVEQVPDLLISQLRDGGKIVTILEDENNPGSYANGVVITKVAKVTSIKKIFQTKASKLAEFNRKKEFSF